MSESWIQAWVEAHRWEVLGVLLGVGLIGSGVFFWRSGLNEPAQPVVVLSASTSAKLMVDVGGEVNSPGVYEFILGARVEEALTAAGGISAQADQNYIDKYLNRAGKLSDGQKLYIPAKGVQNDRMDINSASPGELEGLPGIGPVTAGKIIAGRPYQNISELVERKVVGSKVFEQIKDLISVW